MMFNYPNGKQITVTQETVKLTPHTFNPKQGIWEKDAIKLFFSYIQNDAHKVIIDVGAQTGLYSLYAKFLPNCQFHAFEPFKPSFDQLNLNLNLNNIKNVKTYNLALSDQKGCNTLNTCPTHNGFHTFGTPLRFNQSIPVQCETETIDNLFFDKQVQVDFIKIDTEGNEYRILKGAMKTIQKYKPIIQLEYHKVNMLQCGVSESDMLALFNELNYKIVSTLKEEMIIAPFTP